MAEARTRLQLAEELQSALPYLQRYRADHLVLGRAVEFRIAREGSGEADWVPLLREMQELAALDHPAFLPVLERGLKQGRPYYAVPLRTGDSLAGRVLDRGFAPGARQAAVYQLARASQAAWLAGYRLGDLDPGQILWDEQNQHLWLAHHKVPPGLDRPAGYRAVVPKAFEGLERGGLAVLEWAKLAFWLLAGGRDAWEDEPGTRPGVLGPAVEPGLARVIDACLRAAGEGRPGDPAELWGLLLLVAKEAAAAPAPRPAPGPAPAAAPPLVVMETGTPGPPPTPAPGLPESQLDLAASIHSLRVPGRLPKPRVAPAADEGGLTLAGLQEAAGEPWARGLALGVVAMGLCFGLATLVMGGGELTRDELGELAGRPGASQEAPADVAAGSAPADPYVAELAALERVEPARFMQVWGRVRGLALENRLPRRVDDERELLPLRAKFATDPDGACAGLEKLLAGLRSGGG